MTLFGACISSFTIKWILKTLFSLPQAVLFEKPGFEGSSLEIDSDIFSFSDDNEANPLKSVGSLKIIGGLWVFFDFFCLFCSK